MADLVRRFLYHAFVLTIIATVWALGHANAKADEAYRRRYWPPLLNPQAFVYEEPPAEAEPSAPPDEIEDI